MMNLGEGDRTPPKPPKSQKAIALPKSQKNDRTLTKPKQAIAPLPKSQNPKSDRTWFSIVLNQTLKQAIALSTNRRISQYSKARSQFPKPPNPTTSDHTHKILKPIALLK
jgi:hypothetical protein